MKQARIRDPDPLLNDFDFEDELDRTPARERATSRFPSLAEDALFLGPPGTGKCDRVSAIGHAVIPNGWDVVYRGAHSLHEEPADGTLGGTRAGHLERMQRVSLWISDVSRAGECRAPAPS